MGSDETQWDSGILRLGHLQYHSYLTSRARHCDTNRSTSVIDLSWGVRTLSPNSLQAANNTQRGGQQPQRLRNTSSGPSPPGRAPPLPSPAHRGKERDGRTPLSVRPASCLRPEVRASHSAPRAAGMITNARGSHAACSAVWTPRCVPRRLPASGAAPAPRRPERWRCSGECGVR